MDTSLAVKKGKKRRAPAPPNPFTGSTSPQPDIRRNPFDDDEEAELDLEEASPTHLREFYLNFMT